MTLARSKSISSGSSKDQKMLWSVCPVVTGTDVTLKDVVPSSESHRLCCISSSKRCSSCPGSNRQLAVETEKRCFPLLKVTLHEEETDSGVLRTYDVSGIEGEKTLLTLPSSRFIPKEVSP